MKFQTISFPIWFSLIDLCKCVAYPSARNALIDNVPLFAQHNLELNTGSLVFVVNATFYLCSWYVCEEPKDFVLMFSVIKTHWGLTRMASTLQWIFTDTFWTVIYISLKFISEDTIDNMPSLVQVMAWCRTGYKPLSEPMKPSLTLHKCISRVPFY